MKYSILVVDDSKLILSLIKNVFESVIDKYSVITAENGKQACEIALHRQPDIILMDWEMPVMDGFEALQTLKTDERTKDIPIIMITSSKNLSEAFENGATDYIHKPIDKTELLVRVKSALVFNKLLKELIQQSDELERQQEILAIQKTKLEEEKQKTDALLQNILPYEIAEQLKNKGYADSKHYRRVSVLFTDFMNFTQISEQLSFKELIKELGTYFEKFDETIEKHYVEKIKTIGDAYMCVGGLPLRNKSNPIDIVLAGLKIQKFVSDYNQVKRTMNQLPWDLRLGIHTGPAIAGVIGKKKFAYDVWGDTVNTASRMESAGQGGKVNISGDTYKYVKHLFDCTYRGKVKAKNKGEIDMYFVNGLKTEYALDEEGVFPNKRFMEILSEY